MYYLYDYTGYGLVIIGAIITLVAQFLVNKKG